MLVLVVLLSGCTYSNQQLTLRLFQEMDEELIRGVNIGSNSVEHNLD